MISASQTEESSAAFQINSYPDGSRKWNWPFTHGGQLLTVRESGSSPLAWLDEYKLTYSPSPPSSFALSLYRKRGGTNPSVRRPRGAQSVQRHQKGLVIKLRRELLVEVLLWYNDGWTLECDHSTATRWHWSASFAKIIAFTGNKNMQSMSIILNWDSLKPVIRQQAVSGQWSWQQDATKCHYHLCNTEQPWTTICQNPVQRTASCFLYVLPSLGELTAEVWRESVSEGSEGRQTATEPIEPAREPLGPPPLPSRMVALVKVTWSKLCDRWKEWKQETKEKWRVK